MSEVNLDPLGLGVDAEVLGDEPAVGGEDTRTPPNGKVEEPSIVDLLKQDFDELASATSVHIPIVGYDKARLTAKYHMPKRSTDIDEINRRVAKDMKGQSAFARSVRTGIETMIFLCEGLYVRPEGMEEPEPLDPYNTGEVADFGSLANIFGWDNTPRVYDMVRRLFANNDMAILSHVEKLNRWLMDAKADLTLEFWQTGE